MKLFSCAIVWRATWVHMRWYRQCHNSQQEKIKATLRALLYIELTSNVHDTSPSLSSFPFWQKNELNSTCVIICNLSSFVNASGPVVTALWAETKRSSLLHRLSYRQGCRLVFKVSDDITSFQQWICHTCRGGEGKTKVKTSATSSCFYLFVPSPFYHDLKVRLLRINDTVTAPFFQVYFSLIYLLCLTWRSKLNHLGREKRSQIKCKRQAPKIHYVSCWSDMHVFLIQKQDSPTS